MLLLGTPLLWWSFLPALVGVGGVRHRPPRLARATRSSWARSSGIVPWFLYEFSDRTMFYFYALPALPFLIMAVVYLFGLIIHTPERAGDDASRRGWFSAGSTEERSAAIAARASYMLVIARLLRVLLSDLRGREDHVRASGSPGCGLGGRWI